ncbi:MAG: hypothetical protein AB9869_06520 [Verrucomicrobiia bacterium]
MPPTRGKTIELVSVAAQFTTTHWSVVAAARDATLPGASADRLFERRWALTLLDTVLQRLEAEQTAADAAARFSVLRPVLLGEPTDEGYVTLARRFGVTESTVKSWVYRLRRRYRELLRAAVMQTVARAEDVEDELRFLVRVISAR